ncbi:MAG: YbhB/YbcL family Raf kinase inhibitor-like protein [Gammaproteobacteria bacterium]|nr:YbhB/YbcL family Raf kinase inhibitor-like protein [Gammaproteobacteria bacterium]
MKLTSNTFNHNERIPERCAFGIPDPVEHLTLGPNKNPQLSWTDVPAEARSLVLICTDPDVPSSLENFNKEGTTIDANLARVEFIHWVMVDIPATDGSVAEGTCSDGIVPRGKDDPNGPAGSRQGINDYTNFMAGDPDMEGDYYGYEGPCPPWNDERLHHYHFVLYAVDIDSTPVSERFTAAEVLSAIDGHTLATAELIGTYSLNPDMN